jgi:hypothetical protein
MRIILNLAQATAIIDTLSYSIPIEGKEKELKEATIIIKEAIQREVQATEVRLESMIIELEEHGYTEITTELVKVRNEIQLQGQKTEDKYFDEEGKIKEQKSK